MRASGGAARMSDWMAAGGEIMSVALTEHTGPWTAGDVEGAARCRCVSPLDVERLPSTQPAFVLGLPSGSDCIKLGSLGERHAGGQLRIAVLAIEVFRSDSAFGSWMASTMAMICPAPAPELGVSPDRLQAD
jgi:hypothetical protein